jgi:hypothetical protein
MPVRRDRCGNVMFHRANCHRPRRFTSTQQGRRRPTPAPHDTGVRSVAP